MQRLGQHFLKSKSAVQKIVGALEIKSGDAIFEIGPGHGELTVSLAEACQKNGAQLTAIEKDEKLSEQLRNLGIKELTITDADVLKILPTLIAQLPNSKIADYKIVGNIPYYITGHLLRVISELEHKPEVSVFTIQKEVAERIVAKPPKMNRLAASVQFWAEPEVIARIPKADFSPPPKIDSAVIRLKKKSSGLKDAGRYYAAVRAIFAQPRKTILNNLALSQQLIANSREQDREKISAMLIKIGIDPGLRSQNLSIQDIVVIAKTFF